MFTVRIKLGVIKEAENQDEANQDHGKFISIRPQGHHSGLSRITDKDGHEQTTSQLPPILEESTKEARASCTKTHANSTLESSSRAVLK